MKPALLVLNLQVPAHLEQMKQTFPDFDVLYAPEADQAEAAIAAHGERVQAVCTIGATGLSAAQMQRMPRLSLVCAMGAGYENI
ncbi:MAG: 2-hydroxyacid dehydrogenase, partial [Comamonas sp.]